jgi:hypothetical protein
MVALLYKQGLTPEQIDVGMQKVYKEHVRAAWIIKNLPVYLGEVDGYAPNERMREVLFMLSEESTP